MDYQEHELLFRLEVGICQRFNGRWEAEEVF